MSDQRSPESINRSKRPATDDLDTHKQPKQTRLDITDAGMEKTHINAPVDTKILHSNLLVGTSTTASGADTLDTVIVTRKAVQPAQPGGPIRCKRQRQAKGALASHVQRRSERMRELNERLIHVFDEPVLTESEKAQVQADVEKEKERASRDAAAQIARMEERLISAREKKASLIRELDEVTARKAKWERQRDEAVKSTAQIVSKCSRVQNDNESMQREVREMEICHLQTKIDTFEDIENIKLASRQKKSDEHQEKVYKFALQEHAQLQESAYEPELEAARSLKAQKLEELQSLKQKYEDLDRKDAEINGRWDSVNEKKRGMSADIERLSQLKAKIAAAMDLYGDRLSARFRASEDLRDACATVFDNNMRIRKELNATRYETRMLRLRQPLNERKPLLKLKWTRKHTLKLTDNLPGILSQLKELNWRKKK
ncbi:hypothetical protein SARC_09711 [Sphaeroforma arctica JP610]|uniref:Uncharacterized protein n=1 Tax=Sphaeroforma arctica JP610 TaxID=667725 RepID=A0A0L0FMU6_9EUKA|nr:hypothetical protein SARC_09711 [Sphaeroforma arctica JP610]KNC77841.1 hypothetical protein SARC_09711 [Sphaeroforma arctica JP610]|eukprot:XP_014151743.1 hypothetical protein SARC_09711 [Sphaeroforma arctica JP610]